MAINFDQNRSGLLGIDSGLLGINTGPNYNQMAEVTQKDIDASKARGFNMLDRDTAVSLGLISPNVTDYEFQQLQEGNITEPGNYTAMAISNFDDIFGNKTFTDAFGVNRNIAGLNRPDINTAPFDVNNPNVMNQGVTNTKTFRNMLLDDLRNLPTDFKTSLGTTKDAFMQDISGLKNFATDLKDKGVDLGSMVISGIGNAIAPGVGFVLNALAKASGPNYRGMIEKDLAEQGYAVDSAGRIVQTGDYATPQNIMAGYNLAAPGITAAAFDRFDKIREGIKKGIFKDKIRAQQKLDALGQFALDKERARKAAYDKAIRDAKNASRREQARISSITAGYGGADESPGATGPTAAGAGMGVGGGYATDFGYDFAKGGIASL